jgi:hypothetical protein
MNDARWALIFEVARARARTLIEARKARAARPCDPLATEAEEAATLAFEEALDVLAEAGFKDDAMHLVSYVIRTRPHDHPGGTMKAVV